MPTRNQFFTAIADSDAIVDAIATQLGCDPAEIKEVADKLVAQTTSKPKAHGTSRAFKRNLELFETCVRPYMEANGPAIASTLAREVEGLPVGSKGVTTAQSVTAILRAAITKGAVAVMPAEDATAWRKAHKVSGKPTVYQLA